MNEQQCSTVNEQQCSTVNEQQCSQTFEQECTTVSEQQCNTVEEEVSQSGGIAAMRDTIVPETSIQGSALTVTLGAVTLGLK